MMYKPKNLPRRAAAAVEFALVCPLLFMLIFGAIDCGRAMMGLDLMANASRDGCRTGCLPQSTNTNVNSAVDSHLSAGGISGYTVSVTVNGSTADVSTAKQGDQIAVSVSVSADSISWLPSSWFFGGKTLTRTTVMRKE